MQEGHWHYILISGILTIVMAASHFLSPLLKRITWLKPRQITSFASGVVVAYVFLHMLPSLVESRDSITELLAKTTHMTPFKDLIVFMSALIGFEIFYFAERYCTLGSTKANIDKKHQFWLHMILYFFYNFLITYTLLLVIESSEYYSILFTIAIGLHFILTDNHFQRHFKEYFKIGAHLILIFALLLGCGLSMALYPIHMYIAAIMNALLGGSVLYNAFVEEITLSRKTSMLSFFIGTAIISAVLSYHLVKH